mmetsp:Transcript_717/g.1045  ORF Transcript_717/g.1045 Transcript_717/m.1045 type:complete len:562 (+) Transcript_717:218-1903(+)
MEGPGDGFRPQPRLSRASWIGGHAAVLLTASLGPGFQSVPIVAPLNLVLLLVLVSAAETGWKLLGLLTVQVLGQWIAYMTAFGTGELLLATFGLVFFSYVVLGLAFVPLLRTLQRRYHMFQLYRGGLWVFPVTFTAFWSFFGLLGPVGSWANFGYYAVTFNSLAQVASVGGLDAINFITAWACSVLYTFWILPRMVDKTQNPEMGGFSPLLEQHDDADAFCAVYKPNRSRHVSGVVAVAMVALTIGGLRPLNVYNKFFQTNIEDWSQGHINAVCLAGYQTFGTPRGRLETTRRIAKQEMFLDSQLNASSADLLVWSEASVQVEGEDEETAFLTEMQSIAQETKTIIGFGYVRTFEQPVDGYLAANMFAVVLENGTIALKYQKVNPVVGKEASIQPGKSPAIPFQTRFGKWGGAICFDFDFPNYIHAASAGADLMIQPGWDWGPIGILHARMDALRAVENGFTLFRCSAGGVSGVYDAYGQIDLEIVLGTDFTNEENSERWYTAQIPVRPRIFTLYTFVGGAIGYWCVLAWLFLFVLAILPSNYVLESELLSKWLDPAEQFL